MTKTTSIEEIIRGRRTVKPASMNGQKIPDTVVRELLELGDWAPTHAHTEPWYFVVFAGDGVREFCRDHAELYRLNTPADRFTTAAYEKLEAMGKTTSHVIALCMKRGDNTKIPEQEEMASTACAGQNILLGAAARGLAGYWGTGGMTYHPSMKEYLGLEEADKLLGFLYLGYAEGALAPGQRIKPLAQKVRWVE
ncbi:nitroreductase family protein [Dinghuibacter silviterrae]|uniref:Nitroreductase n=1 Tax=Dinghuibacter silviterrae TaxID=1539049 RepID=A0A4R8DNG7_9BACT|nr:nitroreductase [Dinghuibacter silviterrae]TDW99571.1 nitroreductase [Dinghuibacter silviterrae]